MLVLEHKKDSPFLFERTLGCSFSIDTVSFKKNLKKHMLQKVSLWQTCGVRLSFFTRRTRYTRLSSGGYAHACRI